MLFCSPPEELVLPKQFPRVRTPLIAALLSPIAWQVGRPDLFDSYSAGVLLLQMAGRLLLPRVASCLHCAKPKHWALLQAIGCDT